MSYLNFRKKCQPFWDRDGLFKGNHNGYPSTNNGLFLTGIYYVFLRMMDSRDVVDTKSFTERVYRHMVSGHQGLWNERVNHPGRISHDDMMLIAAAGFFWNADIPRKIVHYGRHNKWMFDNTRPGVFDWNVWHGRFLGVIQHYKVSAGEILKDADSLLWCLGIWTSIWWSKGTSGLQKDLFAVLVMINSPLNHTWLVKRTIRAYRKHVNEKWGSVKGMLTVYHGKAHPFVEYADHLDLVLRKF